MRAKQIASSAVRSAEIKNGSVSRRDLSRGAQPNLMDNIQIVRSPIGGSASCTAGQDCVSDTFANCGEGARALGGSVEAPDGFENMRITVDRPTQIRLTSPIPDGWAGTIRYTAKASNNPLPTVYAICLMP